MAKDEGVGGGAVMLATLLARLGAADLYLRDAQEGKAARKPSSAGLPPGCLLQMPGCGTNWS